MQAARWAREAGMPVTIDLDAAYPGIDDLAPMVDCLITSQGMANELAGTMDEQQALKKLHERYGCYLVAMTQGARGALAYVENQFIASPAFRPPVIRDTTGAGDAFRAGFIYGLCKGLNIEETMRAANAVDEQAIKLQERLAAEHRHPVARLTYGIENLCLAKTRFTCIFNNFACLSPNQNFGDQKLILA